VIPGLQQDQPRGIALSHHVHRQLVILKQTKSRYVPLLAISELLLYSRYLADALCEWKEEPEILLVQGRGSTITESTKIKDFSAHGRR
jgi:hypothetical protein